MPKTQFTEMNYFAQIPYYVLFSEGISINELLLYSLIHRFEHHPDARKRAFFSYGWLSEQLEIDVRSAKRIAQKLKEKGFITHQLINGKWIWNTARFEVTMKEEESMTERVMAEEMVTEPVTINVTEPVTHKHNELKDNEKAAAAAASCAIPNRAREAEPEAQPASQASVFFISEEADKELLRFNRDYALHAKDNEEFLRWCKYCFDVRIKATDTDGKLKVLKSWIRRDHGLPKPPGYGEAKPAAAPASGYASERSKFAQEATSGSAYTMYKREKDELSVEESVALHKRNLANLEKIKAGLGLITDKIMIKD